MLFRSRFGDLASQQNWEAQASVPKYKMKNEDRRKTCNITGPVNNRGHANQNYHNGQILKLNEVYNHSVYFSQYTILTEHKDSV
jgi:hypothetical protein